MAQDRSYVKKQKDAIYLKPYGKCMHPRIGEEYQASLPTLLTPSDPYDISWKGSVISESPSTPWTHLEVASFLIALYIFGKNFFLAREFLGGRDMRDILSLYYGSFYNSKKYRRWAKRRESARGQKPLTEIGTKRIFLRLRPKVSREFRDATKKAHKECKGTTSLMNYALLMKSTVGPEAILKGIKRELSYLDVDEGQTSRTVAKKESNASKHAKRGADPPTTVRPVKWRKLTELESKPIKEDQQLKNESNGLVSESSNERRRSRRSTVMSTKAVEAFETCSSISRRGRRPSTKS